MANIIQSFPKGSGKGGHTILDNGSATTERDTLNLIDFDISDDSTDLETDITPHELTSAELSEIFADVPAQATLPAHQIVDKNNVTLTQRRMLKFTGGATITDDSGNDTTIVDISGGSGDAGHTIQDASGTDLTQRDTMQFAGDFEAEDDSTDLKTVIMPHELTSVEMLEIMSTVPGSTTQFPVIYDERGTEYVIGKYILSNGTSKPVYEKTTIGTTPSANGTLFNVSSLNIDKLITLYGVVTQSGGQQLPFNFRSVDGGDTLSAYYLKNAVASYTAQTIQYRASSGYFNIPFICTIRYTKTTDTPE